MRRCGSGCCRSAPRRSIGCCRRCALRLRGVGADVVAHGGTSVSGGFVQAMVLTDVATGWTECVRILLRESGLVIEAIGKARTLFPFPLRGVDFDNDGVFMNEAVIGWCRDTGLE